MDHGSGGRRLVGVAVGKFNPPHLGHAHLLRSAAAQVDHLHVLLCDRTDQTLTATDRARWLADALPADVTVHVTPDDLPEENEPWAARALALLPAPPDLAFTSEDWGPGWASAMGARHIMVDRDRVTVPITGTALRADLVGHFDHLVPAARAALCHRIAVVGAESTGKSTLAEALAAHLRTVWVPEHGRWYWQGRRHLTDQTWHAEEFVRIARAQGQLEDDLARRASSGLLIADTDALTTGVWARRYLRPTGPAALTPSAPTADGAGRETELDSELGSLGELVRARRPDHYLICSPDIPWVQDGTRESEAERDAMHAATVQAVAASGVPHTLLTGDHEARMAAAVGVATALQASRTPLT